MSSGTFWNYFFVKHDHVHSEFANHRCKKSTNWGNDFPFVIHITAENKNNVVLCCGIFNILGVHKNSKSSVSQVALEKF